MADFNQSFEKEVIAEMRGVNDEQGNSPFWESVGRIFFDIDFPTADYLSGIDKSFIRDLMPPYPIYASLLPKESQNVIGKVHPKTEPALNILYNEGFRFSGFVDIFDGGPLVIVELDQIRSIRTSEIARVESICQKPPESQDYVISNTRHDFRAIKGQLSKKGGGVQLSEEEAQALQVNEGDPVRYVLLRH
jgi:arginine N-succinyltransferase